MSEKALAPVVQKQVLFYDDEITAVLVQIDGRQRVYVPVRPICDFLGVDWSAQRQRIRRDPVLSELLQGVVVTTTPSASGRGGGPQEMSCLPLDYLNGWLFGINVNRVRPELRDPLIRYQRECYKVLAEAFQEGRLTADPTFDELLATDSPAVQTYKMMRAMTQLARNQVLMEARLSGRLDDHGRRLEQIEATLGDPGQQITPSQAMQISQAVKAIARELSNRSGRNEYGGVYGELYRRYEINSYKILPAGKFNEAMAWLNEWLQDLIGEAPF